MRHLSRLSCSFIAGLGLLAGCPDRQIAEVNPDQSKVEQKTIGLSLERKLDLLFVIDNSSSMKDEQESLAANFPDFINVLETIEGGLPDIHIGVVTSDVGTFGGPTISGCSGFGDNGQLQTLPGLLTSNAFIADAPSPDGSQRITNYRAPGATSPSLASVFGQIATSVGIQGCGFEAHLESMKRALQPDGPAAATNAGFLRDDAFLAVVVIADEDDCSVANNGFFDDPSGNATSQLGFLQSFRCFEFGVTCDDVSDPRAEGLRTGCRPKDDSPYLAVASEYASFLKSLKPGHEDRVIVSGIIGNVTPVEVGRGAAGTATAGQPVLRHSCNYTPTGSTTVQHADPAIRLKFFLDQFSNQSSSSTICDTNLSDALQQVAGLLKRTLGSRCIEGELAEPTTCAVTQVLEPGEVNESRTVVPQCTGTAATGPCWRIEGDTDHCAEYPSQQAITFVFPDDVVPANAEMQVACVLADSTSP